MDSNRKKELINSLANDDNSFTEIMSRKEKRKRAKQKKFDLRQPRSSAPTI